MSVSKWAYEPDKCDGEPCVGDCDLCDKKEIILRDRRYTIFAAHIMSKILAIYITDEKFKADIDAVVNDGSYIEVEGKKVSEFENAEFKLNFALMKFAKAITEEWFSDDDE